MTQYIVTFATSSGKRRVYAKRSRNSARPWATFFCCAFAIVRGGTAAPLAAELESTLQCEQWGFAEIVLQGPADGNPFLNVELSATFQRDGRQQHVQGFYDGEGVYRIRFMPDEVGVWAYTTHSNEKLLDRKSGNIEATRPSPSNHGPVRIHNIYHFAYADGTPYRPLGTTCYAWTHQGDTLEQQTLGTLAEASFNKLRMCVFPKRYTWNQNEPPLYPFAGTPPNQWDFTRFNPAFFRHLEQRVLDLQKLGIEADLILLHPYDEGHWGFDRMPDDVDDRYVQYVMARLAAYRNIWWSLANEFDFMLEKQPEDWDRLFQIVVRFDPYERLRSIHNGRVLYNHNQRWVTHASIQNGSAAEEPGRAVLFRDVYRKPVVFDEIKYEGDIPKRWGNLSPEDLVHRFWACIIAGTYPGHGECYLSKDDVLWWSKGGVLRGQSPPRIAFLRDIMKTAPADGIEPIDKWQYANIGGKPGAYYLVYFGQDRPRSWKFFLPRYELADGMKFRIELLDTWDMKIEPVEWEAQIRRESEYAFVDKDGRAVELPGKPGMALRITRVQGD
jgi:hypothetical protein